jgi:murein DD-endopeptidase MepM/ murein hydrolase activator NlpD
MSDSDPTTPQEQKTLARLNRQASRARRERVRMRRRPDTEPAAGDDSSIPDSVAPEKPRRARRPRLRRLLIRLGLTGAGILLLMVLFPPFMVPVDGRITSRFFLRTEPESIFLFDVEHHRGIDFGAASGAAIRAARSGRVVSVAPNPTYGMVVDIRHPLGMITRYAHMSEQSVLEGQWVWRRRKIGEVGMTGRATGPHLHFEIRLADRSLPPGLFLMFDQLRRTVLGVR